MLAEVGEGGYSVRDFEILQQLGRLSWVRVHTCWWQITPTTLQAHAATLSACRSLRQLRRTRCSYREPPCSSRLPSLPSLHVTTVACPSRCLLAPSSHMLLHVSPVSVVNITCTPTQEPVTVLLKEYLPAARSVACNELQTLVHLIEGLPSRKWHAANAPLSADPPIVPILGVGNSSSRIVAFAGPCSNSNV